jgi:hypothetical protein
VQFSVAFASQRSHCLCPVPQCLQSMLTEESCCAALNSQPTLGCPLPYILPYVTAPPQCNTAHQSLTVAFSAAHACVDAPHLSSCKPPPYPPPSRPQPTLPTPTPARPHTCQVVAAKDGLVEFVLADVHQRQVKASQACSTAHSTPQHTTPSTQ